MEIDVLISEIMLMKKHFPGFTLKKSTGKDEVFFWQGWVSPLGMRNWEIQLTYEDCYPMVLDKELGGIRISVINPDIDKIVKQYKNKTKIPHVNVVVLKNNMEQEETCLCVMEPSYYDNKKHALNAVQSCALACKWLALFEMWLIGIIGEEFEKEEVF